LGDSQNAKIVSLGRYELNRFARRAEKGRVVLMVTAPAPYWGFRVHEENRENYTEKELPHPHERFTFGFCNLKPESINDSE
jgi:hypothetical protein